MTDSDLQRFVEAQTDIYPTALGELRAGRKRTHWMWFVFPQIAGLGHSAMARHYAIASRDETAAYLAHDFWARGCASARTPFSPCPTAPPTPSSARRTISSFDRA